MNAACGAKTSNGKEAMFEELHRKMNAFWNNDRTLSQTDPEYVKLFSDFAYGEVVNEPGANHPDLDNQTRSLAILAALVGCQGLDAFEMMLPVAYETGLTSVAIKEMIYQATAYCGFGRTLPFLKKLNVFLGAANVHLPLEPQGTTTSETRAQAGEDKQVETSARTCVDSRNPDRRRPGTSTSGSADELLRRLLHSRRTRHPRARNGHVVFPGRAGWLRTAAYGACQGEYGRRQ